MRNLRKTREESYVYVIEMRSFLISLTVFVTMFILRRCRAVNVGS